MSNNFVLLKCTDIYGKEKETIINLDHVLYIDTTYNDSYCIYMTDNKMLLMPNETYNQLVKGIKK